MAKKDGKHANLFAMKVRPQANYATRATALPPAAKVFSLIWLFSASRPRQKPAIPQTLICASGGRLI
jgi:hypothetical protein